MMQSKTLILVLFAVLFSVAGQLFLKAGAQQLSAYSRMDFLLAAFRDARVLAGLTAWAASTICWLYVLKVAPLSRAYGLTSLTYVLIFIASILMYGEQVRRVHVVGTMLIVMGIACLLYGK